MEYTFSQLSNIAKSLRERYPVGTRIKLLSMGDDPHPIPPGTKGTVEGIDDIATVFVRFDNGRRLGLAYGEDHYRALTPAELFEEKCQKNFEKFTTRVDRDILGEIDFERLKGEMERNENQYIQEILKSLHNTFVDVYGTDSVNEDLGFIEVPAMIESVKTGKYYPGLVRLDMCSSGEHFGTTVIAPEGIIDQNADDNTEEEKTFLKTLIPYHYSLRSLGSPELKDLSICSLKTFPDCYRMTAAGHLRPSSVRFRNWGTMSHGRFLTARILEYPKPEKECFLSAILEKNAPERYYLSPMQIQKLLFKSSVANKATESMTKTD